MKGLPFRGGARLRCGRAVLIGADFVQASSAKLSDVSYQTINGNDRCEK